MLLTETSQNVVRDITVTAEDETHLEVILEAMRNNEGTRVLEVRDEVLELHQKGKIAIRREAYIEIAAATVVIHTPNPGPSLAVRHETTPNRTKTIARII